VLRSLMQLNLQSNQLSATIPKLDLPKLRYLDLSRNKISNLQEFVHSDLPSLLQLDISHNEIETIPPLKLDMVEVFNFSNNQVKVLDNRDYVMPKLTHVFGSHN